MSIIEHDEMTVVVALTGDDQERFCRHVLARNRLDRRLTVQSIVSGVLGIVFVVLVVWLVAGPDWYADRKAASLAVIFAILWIGFVIVYHRARLHLLLRRFRQHRSGAERVTISAAGIAAASEQGAADLSWAAFNAVETIPQAIYLFVDDEHGMIIPRHAFADDATFRRYNEQLRALWSAAR